MKLTRITDYESQRVCRSANYKQQGPLHSYRVQEHSNLPLRTRWGEYHRQSELEAMGLSQILGLNPKAINGDRVLSATGLMEEAAILRNLGLSICI